MTSGCNVSVVAAAKLIPLRFVCLLSLPKRIASHSNSGIFALFSLAVS